jgi:AcrR family transcriptional regulator
MVPVATKALHPTAQKLVDTVKEMLKETPYNNIKSENVLFRSKISRGPLYHHFENFEDLIEVAQTQIYQDYVGGVFNSLMSALLALKDPMATRDEFARIVRESESGNSESLRRQRVGLVHNAASIPSFGEKLSATQEILNQQWMKIYQICIDKGWADVSIEPRTVAILMQSIFFGRILDDISPLQMNPDAWIVTLTRLLDSFFFNTVLAERIQY